MTKTKANFQDWNIKDSFIFYLVDFVCPALDWFVDVVDVVAAFSLFIVFNSRNKMFASFIELNSMQKG